MADPPNQIEAGLDRLFEDPDFHFTTAQKKRCGKLADALSLKWGSHGEVMRRVPLDELRRTAGTPKQRTSRLIQLLGDLLNPFGARLRARLNRLTAPLTEANCTVKFTRDYEDDAFELSARITDKQDIERLKRALETLPYDDIVACLRGEVDV